MQIRLIPISAAVVFGATQLMVTELDEAEVVEQPPWFDVELVATQVGAPLKIPDEKVAVYEPVPVRETDTQEPV